MNVRTNMKAISILITIILMIISAIIGGIASYAFTIAYYTRTSPAIIITGIYINKENANSFKVSVLNPSYSPMDATISRIAISLKGEMQLYDVIETEPSIENGIVLPIGEARNITCLKIKKDNANFTLGDFIGSFGFAGKTMMVHVFSSDFPATSREVKVPYVKLSITEEFNSRYSFKKFNITLTNDPQSEVDLTISDMLIGVDYSQVEPPIRGHVIPRNESVRFNFTGDWHGVLKTSIVIYTEQGYNFRKEIETKSVHAAIQSVNFDVTHRDHFNVTIFNLAESAHYANITMVRCKLDNGTYIHDELCNPPVGIMPNSTVTIKYHWNWTEYRGRNVTIAAYFLQDFETTPYTAKTPHPIIVEVKNAVFDLREKGQFNVTIQNHASSIEAIRIAQIVVNETGTILNGTKVYPTLPSEPIEPSNSTSFNCTFNWAALIEDYRNLTLIIHVEATIDGTLKNYTFPFTFTLPVAELNITAVDCVEIGGTRYLNATVKNLDYSLWNLTLSKIVITVQGITAPMEYVFPKNQTLINVGDEIVLLCPFDWQRYQGKDITVTVFTDEYVEASFTYNVP